MSDQDNDQPLGIPPGSYTIAEAASMIRLFDPEGEEPLTPADDGDFLALESAFARLKVEFASLKERRDAAALRWLELKGGVFVVGDCVYRIADKRKTGIQSGKAPALLSLLVERAIEAGGGAESILDACGGDLQAFPAAMLKALSPMLETVIGGSSLKFAGARDALPVEERGEWLVDETTGAVEVVAYSKKIVDNAQRRQAAKREAARTAAAAMGG